MSVSLPSEPPVTIRSILAERRVRVVILVVFVIMLGFGIVAPILPLYARSFGVSYDAAGLLISAFAMTRLAFDLVAGPIVDRFGERIAAATGTVVVGISSLATAFAPTFTIAVVTRAAGGAGSAVLFAALFSYLLKVVPKERMARTMSVFYGAFNIGVIAGAPLGGVVAHWWGLASPLIVYAIVLFVAGGLYLRFVPDAETPADLAAEAAHGTFLGRLRERLGMLLTDRTFLIVIFANFAYLWFIAGVFDTLMPLFGSDGLGLTTLGIGVAFAVALAAEFAVLYHAGSLSDRYGRKSVLVPAMLALGITVAAAGWATSVAVYLVLIALMGFASGYAGVPPGAMLADVTTNEGRGTAVGVFRFAGDLGFVLGPLTAGFATDALGFRGAFAIAAVPMLACALLALAMPETLASASRGPGSSPASRSSGPG